ncbi:MAG: hypothetical protein WC852_05775 [Candidatus Nanoarchaeia archaeon]|jgi:hypothetical protein
MKYYTLEKIDNLRNSSYRVGEYKNQDALKAALLSAAKTGQMPLAARELEMKLSFEAAPPVKSIEGQYYLIRKTQRYYQGDDGGCYSDEYAVEEYKNTSALLVAMQTETFCTEVIPAQGLEYKIELILGETKLGRN